MKPLHSLLKRQLKKHFPSGQIPEVVREFIDTINQSYHEFDQDRNMLEHSLEYSSQELFQANADVRALFEAFPDVLFRVDREGTILDCRAGKTADLYLPREQLIGKKIQEGPSENNAVFESSLRKVFETKKMISFEYEMTWNQVARYFEARITPFLEDQLMIVIRNVDERKKMEAQLMQSQKMESVGQLAAGIAHEINNPMGVILGFAQGLLRRLPAGDAREMPLKSIEREAIRCKNLVSELLVFSRSGKKEQAIVNVNAALEGAVALVSVQAKIKDVRLVTEFSKGLPPIFGNQDNLQQVVINLCTNAIDVVKPGDSIYLTTNRVRQENRYWVEIVVRDCGSGIPAAVRSKIFEPFFTTKEPGKGTGLGLSLVYEMIQKHGGKIDFETVEGKGTAFRVLLPAEEAR